jgi:hypothetical protein
MLASLLFRNEALDIFCFSSGFSLVGRLFAVGGGGESFIVVITNCSHSRGGLQSEGGHDDEDDHEKGTPLG